VSETVSQRTERDDFQATTDPAVMESADRGEVNLLTYEQLYNLWERQQWATQDIDFTQDRMDWL
jgi:ribonucleoside-diphosphate reductase beta chain